MFPSLPLSFPPSPVFSLRFSCSAVLSSLLSFIPCSSLFLPSLAALSLPISPHPCFVYARLYLISRVRILSPFSHLAKLNSYSISNASLLSGLGKLKSTFILYISVSLPNHQLYPTVLTPSYLTLHQPRQHYRRRVR